MNDGQRLRYARHIRLDDIGIDGHAKNLLETPLKDYEASFLQTEWMRQFTPHTSLAGAQNP